MSAGEGGAEEEEEEGGRGEEEERKKGGGALTEESDGIGVIVCFQASFRSASTSEQDFNVSWVMT
jgi:hypothetical protein